MSRAGILHLTESSWGELGTWYSGVLKFKNALGLDTAEMGLLKDVK